MKKLIKDPILITITCFVEKPLLPDKNIYPRIAPSIQPKVIGNILLIDFNNNFPLFIQCNPYPFLLNTNDFSILIVNKNLLYLRYILHYSFNTYNKNYHIND